VWDAVVIVADVLLALRVRVPARAHLATRGGVMFARTCLCCMENHE
jgi:hypothetical protein